ncbi:MAG: sortase [Parcubacteria group bacterium]|nr:sortase [Parcubacteria group bacterium]
MQETPFFISQSTTLKELNRALKGPRLLYRLEGYLKLVLGQLAFGVKGLGSSFLLAARWCKTQLAYWGEGFTRERLRAQLKLLEQFLRLFVVIFLVSYIGLSWRFLIVQAQYRLGLVKPFARVLAYRDATASAIPTVDPILESVKALALTLDERDYIVIPKINVITPVVYEETRAEWKIQKALNQGVVHYAGTALPGEEGNVFLVGHSSSWVGNTSPYVAIFSLIAELKENDEAFFIRDDKIYRYHYRDAVIVEPSDLSVLTPSGTRVISLMTCWPLGTTLKRLVVRMDEVRYYPRPVTETAPAI